MVALIKDRNINRGLVSKMIYPVDQDCRRRVQRYGLWKAASEEESDVVQIETVPQRITNTNVANRVARRIVLECSSFLDCPEQKIPELYSVLIELMANTNNHAVPGETGRFAWWLFVRPNEDVQGIDFVFLDLGVGVFESLPVRQHVTRSSDYSGSPRVGAESFVRQRHISKIVGELSKGYIKSSTGDPDRGLGFPLIFEKAKSDRFERFTMIANDGTVDLKKRSVSLINGNFLGTAFHFVLR